MEEDLAVIENREMLQLIRSLRESLTKLESSLIHPVVAEPMTAHQKSTGFKVPKRRARSVPKVKSEVSGSKPKSVKRRRPASPRSPTPKKAAIKNAKNKRTGLKPMKVKTEDPMGSKISSARQTNRDCTC